MRQWGVGELSVPYFLFDIGMPDASYWVPWLLFACRPSSWQRWWWSSMAFCISDEGVHRLTSSLKDLHTNDWCSRYINWCSWYITMIWVQLVDLQNEIWTTGWGCLNLKYRTSMYLLRTQNPHRIQHLNNAVNELTTSATLNNWIDLNWMVMRSSWLFNDVLMVG